MQPSSRLRVAIVGGGVSGLATAWLLQEHHDVTLYEGTPFLGGHARSIAVESGSAQVFVETGFKYFFDETYPTLVAFARQLGLTLRRCKPSINIARAGRSLLVLPPRSLGQVARLFFSAGSLREALAFRRFLVDGHALVDARDWGPTLRQYAGSRPAIAAIAESFLYPLIASSWGAPLDVMPDFPAYDVLKVLLGGKSGGLGFYEFEGGSSTYVAALARQLGEARLRLGTAVQALARDGDRDGWRISDTAGQIDGFDRVVVATGAPQAHALLRTDPAASRHADVVGRFRHFDTRIVIHRDPSWMPPTRADWCTFNHRVEGRHAWSTEWSGWREREPVFRTWMPPGRPLPAGVVHDQSFQHLVMTAHSLALQRQVAELQGREGLYLAGMYTTDVDDHESALLSAAAVAKMLAPEGRRRLPEA
jgi:predicted NAD/FAD-binding protein